MDELYDNLENYNDVNLIQELRNENEELKTKVENYTVALEKLQKDFDKLAAEYKTLEVNYSSLLKTARAEVERKTQIITSLNLEKDMMVLNAIQNKNVLNLRRNWSIGKANNNPKGHEVDANNKKTSEQQPKSRSSSIGRKEASQTPSDETPTMASTENANKVNIKNEKPVECASDAKENVGGDGQKARPARPGNIRNRRKSMPATSFRPSKFSSDEEGEISTPPRDLPREPKRKEPESRERDFWRNSDRNYSKQDRPDTRKYDNVKFRSKNKFEAQRRRFSPERLHHRSIKEYSGDRRSHRFRDSSGGYRSDKDILQRPHRDESGDYNQYRDRSGDRRHHRDSSGDKPRREDSGDRYKRPEHRKRRLESPSRDKYDTYQQKNHEQFEKDYYEERNKYLEDPTKVKYLSDYDEPSHKRLRTDSYHRTEQDGWFLGRRETDQGLTTAVGSLQGAGDISCQSPDYLTNELASVPKEIKLDAEVKIDDPREHSNKYIVRTENGEKVLSTVSGRTINLKPVTKSVWKDLIEVKMPVDLVRPPRQIYEDLANKVQGHIDMDDHASEVSSMESGETIGSVVHDISDPYLGRGASHYRNETQLKEKTEHSQKYKKKTIQRENVENLENSEKQIITDTGNVIEESQCYDKGTTQMENPKCSRSHEEQINHTEKVTEGPQNFENQNNESEKKDEDPQSYENKAVQIETAAILQSCQKVAKGNENVEETTKKASDNWKTKYKIPKRSKDNSDNLERTHDKNIKITEVDKHNSIRLGHKTANKLREANDTERKIDKVSVVVTGREMVEGDLALSDDNSDNIELMKHVTKEPIDQSLNESKKSHVDIERRIDKVLDKDSKGDKECSKSINDLKEIDGASNQSEEEKAEELSRENNSKGKSKKKSTKPKVTKSAVEKSDKDDDLRVNATPKTLETVMSKEIKSKFCDLFGDTSSSLITPEDLGLTAPVVRIESSPSNYFPIFEDAQDAIDVSAKVAGQTSLAPLAIQEKLFSISENTEQNQHFVNQMAMTEKKSKADKNAENEVHDDKLKDANEAKPRSKSKQQTDVEVSDVNLMEVKETKSKSSKNSEKDKHISKKIEANEDTSNKLLAQEQHSNKILSTIDTKSKSKSKKSTETEKLDEKPSELYASRTIDGGEGKYKSKLRKPTEMERNNDNHEKEQHYFYDEIVDTNETMQSKPRKITEIEKHEDILNEEQQLPANKRTHASATNLTTKTIKHIETEHLDKPSDANEIIPSKSTEIALLSDKNAETHDKKPKTSEIKRRKSRRNEEKSNLTADAPQPAVIAVENIAIAQKEAILLTDNITKEPDVVKTVIISSGVQPASANPVQAVNNFSPILLEPPVTPNIDNRQTKVEIPLLSHSVQIHALATSTPAKELPAVDVNRESEVSRTPDVSNASDQSNNVSHQDMDAPDVRIFVKRRRRVVKKTTPSKT